MAGLVVWPCCPCEELLPALFDMLPTLSLYSLAISSSIGNQKISSLLATRVFEASGKTSYIKQTQQ